MRRYQSTVLSSKPLPSLSLWTALLGVLCLATIAPACVGDVGPAGPSGVKGADGAPGAPGNDGTNGANGTHGNDGAPGKDATVDPALSPVEKALLAAGGKAALLGLKTISFDAAGGQWLTDESFSAADPSVQSGTFSMTLSYDVAADKLRLDYKRDIEFAIFKGHTEYSEIMPGQVGYVLGSDSLFGAPGGNMTSDRWASGRKQQRLLNPQLLLREIASDPSLASDGGAAVLDGSLHHLVVVKDAVHPITLFVNAATGTIDKLVTLESDYLHRDVTIEVFYEGWAPAAGGLSFPEEVYLARDGDMIRSEARSAVKVDSALDASLFDLPAGASPTHDDALAQWGEESPQSDQMFSGAGLAHDGQQLFVSANAIAPGVYHLTGGSHHTLAVEQANGIVLVDAPLYELRSLAILDWVKATFPSKPVTHVIATHFHQDHTGGMRTFVAKGAIAVVGAASKPFYERLFAAPSTVVPDALALAPTKAVIQTIPAGGSFTIPDALRPVTAYAITSSHAEDMLMAYAPSQQVAYVTDIYNPSSPPFVPPPFLTYGLELHAAIVGLGLPVAKIAGGHGGAPNTFAEFKAALGL